MSAVTWSRKQGDTGQPLTAVLRQPPAWGQRHGDPVDLTGATLLSAVFTNVERRSVVAEVEPTVSGPATGGTISIALPAAVHGYPALYLVTVNADVGAGEVTYPLDTLWYLSITADPLADVAAAQPILAGATRTVVYDADADEWVVDPDALVYVIDTNNPAPTSKPGDIAIRKP